MLGAPYCFLKLIIKNEEKQMKIKTFLLCSVVITMGGYSAYGQTSGPRYTPRPAVSQNDYTEKNRMEDRFDITRYEQYEQREPCQYYRRLPRNYTELCAVFVEQEYNVVETTQVVHQNQLLPIVRSYTILFDFDKSNIRAEENAVLNRIMDEINMYNPQQVTVTGYTDSSGKAGYNQDLSRRREQAVSRALLERGIANQTLEREARGEYDQAVQTPDGTRNQQNRRVVVDFRR
jgi:outer membrane protein OmpA-like peptidoglycan-associated protein